MLLLMMTGCKEQPPKDEHYGVKSGIIRKVAVRSTGAIQKQNIYFDDYGDKETVETIELKGDSIALHLLDIRNPHSQQKIQVDLIKKVACYDSEFLISIPTYHGLPPKAMKAMKETGMETVGGKKCKVYTVNTIDLNPSGIELKLIVWVWKGIPLQESFWVCDEIIRTLELSSIETDIPISAETFEIPKGVKIVENNSTSIDPEVSLFMLRHSQSPRPTGKVRGAQGNQDCESDKPERRGRLTSPSPQIHLPPLLFNVRSTWGNSFADIGMNSLARWL